MNAGLRPSPADDGPQPASYAVGAATVVLSALAGGMAWGIRGQYGHETGAMLAGLLVSAVAAMLSCSGQSGPATLRAMAWCTIAMGFGGSETYGQTIGLTQDPALLHNHAAWRWGMLGLAIKGSVWIGFAGVFLGMGLSGRRYTARDLLPLMLSLPVLYLAGVGLLNSPYDPAHRQLPSLYFSADWFWQPDAELKPRYECWGGLWLALIGVLVWARLWHGDRLAARLGLAGIIGGALGFPGGQCLQSLHAWQPELVQSVVGKSLDSLINWWNLMEITFGATMGAALGLAAWLNRHLIRPQLPDTRDAPVWLSTLLLALHLALLSVSEFGAVPVVDAVYGLGLCMGIIPMVAVTLSRWWASALLLPVLFLPLAGKTLRRMVYQSEHVAAEWGWLLYFALPMLLAVIAAWRLQAQAGRGLPGEQLACRCLLWGAWLSFALNFAFFDFPWPWQPWTGRTPSALVFVVCLTGLSGAALRVWYRGLPPAVSRS